MFCSMQKHRHGPLQKIDDPPKNMSMHSLTGRNRCMAVARLLTPLQWLHTLSLCYPVKHALMKREEVEGGLRSAGREVPVVGEPTAKGHRGKVGGGRGTYITETSRFRVPKELLV